MSDRGEMDLRLHAPRPDVVIVRVSGPVDGRAARLLADRVGKQLHRAPHIVLDLADVSVLGPRVLTALAALHQQAMACEAQLHLVGTEHDAVRRPLHASGLAQLLSIEPTADAVIVGLPRSVSSRVGSCRIGPDPDDKDPAARQTAGSEASQPLPPPSPRDHPNRAMTACSQQWQDAELAMNIARRCFEGWLQASQEDEDTPFTASMHAYHAHEALHEVARAISLLIEALRAGTMALARPGMVARPPGATSGMSADRE